MKTITCKEGSIAINFDHVIAMETEQDNHLLVHLTGRIAIRIHFKQNANRSEFMTHGSAVVFSVLGFQVVSPKL